MYNARTSGHKLFSMALTEIRECHQIDQFRHFTSGNYGTEVHGVVTLEDEVTCQEVRVNGVIGSKRKLSVYT